MSLHRYTLAVYMNSLPIKKLFREATDNVDNTERRNSYEINRKRALDEKIWQSRRPR